MNSVLTWYDTLAALYAFPPFSDWWYRRPRANAVRALDLREGDVVIDLFCGTGINFGPVLERVGPTGTLIGIVRKGDG